MVGRNIWSCKQQHSHTNEDYEKWEADWMSYTGDLAGPKLEIKGVELVDVAGGSKVDRKLYFVFPQSF